MTHQGPSQVSLLDSIIARAISPSTDGSQVLDPKDQEDISSLFLEVRVNLYQCHTLWKLFNVFSGEMRIFCFFFLFLLWGRIGIYPSYSMYRVLSLSNTNGMLLIIKLQWGKEVGLGNSILQILSVIVWIIFYEQPKKLITNAIPIGLLMRVIPQKFLYLFRALFKTCILYVMTIMCICRRMPIWNLYVMLFEMLRWIPLDVFANIVKSCE